MTGRGSGAGPDSGIRPSEPSRACVSAQLERVLQEPVKLSVAGRTDAGVHARGQVASFTTASSVPPERLQKALERGARARAGGGRSRRTRLRASTRASRRRAREYVYRIHEAALPDPFTARFVWHRPGISAWVRCARPLVSWSGSTISRASVAIPAETVRPSGISGGSPSAGRATSLSIRAVANAFLHHMVRSLVGTLVAVGEGALEAGAMPEILDARDREAAGPPAPARGLTLERVHYRSIKPHVEL